MFSNSPFREHFLDVTIINPCVGVRPAIPACCPVDAPSCHRPPSLGSLFVFHRKREERRMNWFISKDEEAGRQGRIEGWKRGVWVNIGKYPKVDESWRKLGKVAAQSFVTLRPPARNLSECRKREKEMQGSLRPIWLLPSFSGWVQIVGCSWMCAGWPFHLKGTLSIVRWRGCSWFHYPFLGRGFPILW